MSLSTPPEAAILITATGERLRFALWQEAVHAHHAAGYTGQLYRESDAPPARVERFKRDTGLADAPAPYVAGATRDPGDAFRVSRERHEALPHLIDACRVVAEAVRAEQREDIVVPVTELRLADDGMLVVPDAGRLPLERASLRQLLARAGCFPRGYDLMTAMAPDLRAYVFDRMVREASLPHDRKVKLRTRQGPEGQRSVFAAMSPRYAAHDADRVLRDVCQALAGRGYRGSVVYIPETSHLRVDATAHADTAAAGDVFKMGYRVTSNDAGQGSIVFCPVAFRCLCLNMQLIQLKQGEGVRWQHRGAVADRAKLRDMVARAEPAFERFAQAWAALQRTRIGDVTLGGEAFDTVPAALRGLVDSRMLRAPLSDERLSEALSAAWAKEPGDSLAHLVNAITRAAHESPSLDDDARTALEEQARDLVTRLGRSLR